MTAADGALAERLVREARVIAVYGVAADPSRPSHEVARYLIEAGYEVYLVNPTETEVLGRPVYPRLQDVPAHIDVVDIFRRAEFMPEVIRDAIEAGAGAVWMQLGLVHEGAAATARAAGLEVVMDRCMKIEHARIAAAGPASGDA
ncbi:MAG: CoA-binding protein [Dehalococcoidia bacterium]